MSRTAERIERLGSPQIKLADLQIWVHGRQFPDHDDYWDGNWLRVTAHCGGQGADVWTDGPIIHLSEVKTWYDALVKMNQTVSGEATLGGLWEPNLKVSMAMDRLGHIGIDVEITPDHMNQRHSFHFEVDQTFLIPLVSQCEEVLSEY